MDGRRQISDPAIQICVSPLLMVVYGHNPLDFRECRRWRHETCGIHFRAADNALDVSGRIRFCVGRVLDAFWRASPL